MQEVQIDIISDLHADFFLKDNPDIEEFVKSFLPVNIGEILIIAGDISRDNRITKMIFKELLKYYKKLFVTMGNHDLYYNPNDDKCQILVINRVKQLKERYQETDVVFLCGNVVEYKGIRIGGIMHWPMLMTPDKIKRWEKKQRNHNKIFCMPEKELIKFSRLHNPTGVNPNLNPKDFYKCQEKKFNEVIKEGCDILVTHFPQVIPPEDLIQPEFRNDPDQDLYYSDHFAAVENSRCKYYIYGHIHTRQIFRKKDINIICNPLGFPKENLNTKIISIKLESTSARI